MIKVAYLSPALPALSETFVYEEIHALERRGISVVPISVRRPSTLIPSQDALAQRTIHIYARHAPLTLFQSLIYLPKFGFKGFAALRLLLADMTTVGFFRAVSWKLAFQFLASAKLAHILLQQKCTHLHVHFAHTPTQIAMYSSILSGIPFTFTAHANDIFSSGLLLTEKAQRASQVVTISEFNAKYLQSLGIPRSKISVVRCGVSFANPAVATYQIRTATLAEPVHIASLGRMVEKKGFDILIYAFAEIINRGQNAMLHLAGDGPLKNELQSLALSLGIDKNVVFEGSLDHSDVAVWMQRMDIFVLACKADQSGDMDGIPVVLMEAMSQFIPVISTRLSGIPELVKHNETGLLATPGDWQSLSTEISQLVTSPDLRLRLATNAQSYVKLEFGQEINIKRLITHFN